MNMIDKVARAIKKNMGEQRDAKPLHGSADNWHATGGTLDLNLLARAAIEAMRGNGLELVEQNIDECFKGFNDTRKACYFIDDEGEINSYRMGVKNALMIFHQKLDKALEEEDGKEK